MFALLLTALAADPDLASLAMTRDGDADRGRVVFNDARTKCATCHAVKAGAESPAVGPNLASVGGKLDRPNLIESILHPSRQINQGYETTVLVLSDGRVVTGVARDRDETTITLYDAENKPHRVARTDIEEQSVSKTSVMPADLAKSLKPGEFVDLIAYLESLRPGGKLSPGESIAGRLAVPEGFEVEAVANGLTAATALETLPDGRVLVAEQGGTLRVVKDGKLLPQPMLTVDAEVWWERGLIGVTVAADFPADPSVFVVYVRKEPYSHHVVSRFTVTGDVADPDSEVVLLEGDDQSKMGGFKPSGHQGGAIHLGPDGMLYVGIGEQTASDPAQDKDTLLGKILRVSPDGSVPPDNPFAEESDGKYAAVWMLGCRNPWTFAFQPGTGRMLINDVGGKFEEIYPGVPGGNAGWPTLDHGPVAEDSPYVGPVHVYPQASIAGGDFCPDDPAWGEWAGKYFFADFVHGWLHAIEPDRTQSQAKKSAAEFATGLRRPTDIRFAADGSLYVLTRNAWVLDGKQSENTGSLLRIRPSR